VASASAPWANTSPPPVLLPRPALASSTNTPPPFVATALKAGGLMKGVVTKTMSTQITSIYRRL
jgi:hypothetical protein